jgi:hypothetical protein
MSVQIALSECAAILNSPMPIPEQGYVRTIVHTLLQTTDKAAWVLFVPQLSNEDLAALVANVGKVFPNLTFTLNTSKPTYEITYTLQ